MNFLKEGKTNWKFLLIVVVLAVIVGGVIFVWQYFESYLDLGFYIRILTLIIGIGFLIWWYIVLSPEERERKRAAQKEPIKHRVFYWVYGVQAVIVFFGIGLLAWIVISSYLSAKERMQMIQQGSIKEEAALEEVIEDETAELVLSEVEGWTTYRNKEYDFAINYPPDILFSNEPPLDYLVRNIWSSVAESDSKGEVIASFVTCQFSNVPPTEPYHSFTSELRIGESSSSKQVENCLEISGFTSQEVIISGYKFYKFEIRDAATGHRMWVEIYRAIHNNTCFSIERLKYGYLFDELENPQSSRFNLEYSQKFKDCYEITGQMLSTLRFLE